MLSSTIQKVLNCFICISGFLPSNPHRLINTSKRKIIFLHCWNSIKKQTPLLSLLLSKQSKSCKAWYLPLQTIRPRWITTKSVRGVWILFISLNLKQAHTLVNFFPPQLQFRRINFRPYSTWKLLKGIVPDTRSIHRSFFTILSLQEHTASNFSN